MGYRFVGAPPTTDLVGLADWIQRELTAIELAFVDFDFIQLKETNVAPVKPRTGMIALADGTNWNPGSGAGFYGYYGGAWSKLG